jgi:type I restriction enzyme S subunit
MRSEWRIRALSDVLEEVIDYRGKTPKKMGGDWTNTGYRVFSAKHIKTGRTVKEAEIRTVSQEVYDKWMQIEVERGDIILTSEAPFGEALYWDSDEKIVLGQRLYGLRADSAVINSKFLYYTVIGHHFQQQLSARSTGTTVRGLRQPDLLKCTVPVPSLATQTAIADTLSCLDAKIEMNNKINENLEAQAQAIFKSWFVDFEPFQDGEFVESELGLIPEGWEVCRLEDFMFFQEGPGIRHWQFVEKDGTPFINIRCIQGQDLDLKTANMVSREEANGRYSHFLVKEWDILMSTSGTLGRYAIVRKDHLPLCMNTSVIRFFPKHDFEHYSYTYGYITSWEFSTHLVEKGSGSVQLNFGPTHLKQISLVKPSEEVLRSYHELVFPMIKKTVQLRHQNSMLAALRDTLLPKLMSGEIEVPVD